MYDGTIFHLLGKLQIYTAETLTQDGCGPAHCAVLEIPVLANLYVFCDEAAKPFAK